MRGYLIDLELRDDTGTVVDPFALGLRLSLFDNGEQVLTDIGTLNFELLTPDVYVGEHILEATYYREDFPELESERVEIYRENFTLIPLTITATVEILS